MFRKSGGVVIFSEIRRKRCSRLRHVLYKECWPTDGYNYLSFLCRAIFLEICPRFWWAFWSEKKNNLVNISVLLVLRNVRLPSYNFAVIVSLFWQPWLWRISSHNLSAGKWFFFTFHHFPKSKIGSKMLRSYINDRKEILRQPQSRIYFGSKCFAYNLPDSDPVVTVERGQ